MAHHLLVEEHIKDGLDAQGEGAFRQGRAERLGNGQGPEGVAVLGQLAAVVEQRQALLQGKQGLRALRLDLVDHVGDQQRLFIFVVADQGQLVDVQVFQRPLGLLQVALEKIAEALGESLVVEAFERRALAADFTHAFEEQALDLVVLGFLGAFEKRVVDLRELPRRAILPGGSSPVDGTPVSVRRSAAGWRGWLRWWEAGCP